MKTFLILALAAVIASCHFDKLFTGGGGTQLSHDPPAGVAFGPGPGPASAGQPLSPVLVMVVDSAGTRVAGADTLITIALGAHPIGARLTGTLSAHAANGVARFADLRIDMAGTGYTLIATVPGLKPDTSAAFEVKPPPPTTGYVTVTTSTTGATPDPDGYTVAVDAGASQPIGNADSVTFSSVPPGSHAVALTGLAPNCSATGGASRNATVVAGDTARVGFAVSCPTPPPTTGSVKVTTNTTGASPDPDGYTVTVEGTSQHIGTSDANGVTFTNLTPGNHTVSLSGIASNCTVNGGPSRIVNVTAGGTAPAAFDIDCPTPPPTTGSLAVTTTTSGGGTDPDGYTVTVDGGGGATQSIGTSATVRFDNLSPGIHTATLSGLASNCSVSGGASKPVNITAGNLLAVTFDVTCTPPPNQSPIVNAGTDPQNVLVGALFSLEGASFSDPDNGPWNVTIEWGDGSQDAFPMSSAGTISRTHSYPVTVLGQDYHLRVTVEDARGAQGSATKTVSVKLI